MYLVFNLCINNMLCKIIHYICNHRLLLSQILTKAVKAVKGGHVSTSIFLVLIIRDFEECCSGRECIGNTM